MRRLACSVRALNWAWFAASFSTVASSWALKWEMMLGWISGRVTALVMMLPILGVLVGGCGVGS